jgi:hypothetical protein
MTADPEYSDPLYALRASISEREWDRIHADEVGGSKYVKTARHEAVAQRLSNLLFRSLTRRDAKSDLTRENRLKGRTQIFVGGSGAGKTRAIERAVLDHAVLRPTDGTEPKRPLLSINAPEIPSPLALYTRLLKAAGYPVLSNLPTEAALQRFKSQARKLGVILIHIDDAANMVVGQDAFRRRRSAERIAACLRGFMEDENPISLIISGLEPVLELYRCDDAFARRSEVLKIEPVQPGEFKQLETKIANWAASANLQFNPTHDLVERLCHAANGQLGLSLEIALQAIAYASRRRCAHGEQPSLGISDFADVYFQRTACSFGRNVFDAPDWRSVDTRNPILLAEEAPKRKRSGK